MTDQTDKFFSVTQAAEKMYEALSDLRQETDGYSDAGRRLDAVAAKSEALAEATMKLLGEQAHQWEKLTQALFGQMGQAFDNLSAQAERQTVHLSSLSGAVAGQQNQLTLLQQGGSDTSRMVTESGQVLDTVAVASRELKGTLDEHGLQLTGIHDDLRDQRGGLRELTRQTRRSVYASALAALLASSALIAVLLR